jgi:hypothetical protein
MPEKITPSWVLGVLLIAAGAAVDAKSRSVVRAVNLRIN